MQNERALACIVPWNPNSDEFKRRTSALIQAMFCSFIEDVYVSCSIEPQNETELKITLAAKDYRNIVPQILPTEAK
jgi:hypothetical protein